MVRVFIAPLAAMLVLGCADVGTGDDTNPFGDGTTGAGTAGGPSTSPTSGEASTTGGSGGATGTPTTDAPTTEAPTSADASTSEPPPGTDDATSTPGDTSGGTGEIALGECIGIGAWESCAQYCEAVLEVCVEAGCGGSTVVYYPDVGACTDMSEGNGADTPCGEPFAMGGGASFARCCCQ